MNIEMLENDTDQATMALIRRRDALGGSFAEPEPVVTELVIDVPPASELECAPTAQALIQAIAEKFNVTDVLAAQWLDSFDFTQYY